MNQNRRDFLRTTMLASLAGGVGLGLGAPGRALAACATAPMPRTLINLMLYGGMDSRFVFMPAPSHPDTAYLDKLWAARRALYSSSYTDYATMFANEYLLTNDPGGGPSFGIFKQCGWLKSQFDQGRVAVVANSFCSRNRRHDQSQLNANTGEPQYDRLIYSRDGWGGRLAEQCGASVKTVELSHEVSVFAQGTDTGDRLKQVVHAQDTRNMALPNEDPTSPRTHRKNVLARALKSYYEARGEETSGSTSPERVFFQHNAAFRALGDEVEARLDACGPLPAELSGLSLNSGHFAQQCRNLYDVCQSPDLFNVRLMSMRYNGWDTHHTQHSRLSSNLADVFGANGGLATAFQQIDTLPGTTNHPGDQLTLFVSSDFGRQLVANGNAGTDHGRGIYTILLGAQVNGGVYGEMFPEREAVADEKGRIPLETSGADILGQTSTERALSQACEWMQPGSAAAVFPNAASSEVESPGLLDNLMSV